MVILNIDVSINKNTMINSIKNIMKKVMEEYFENESLTKNKNKLVENIIKTNIDKIKDKYFWYLNSSENTCIHIYKRGKNEGFMCQKKIKTNLVDNKSDYLCCKHSKKHIPKKRKEKTNPAHKCVTYNVKDKSLNKIKIINNKKDLKNICKKKNKKNKKILICNSGILDIGKLIGSLLN
jgi:hypothetical protein